MTGEEWEYKGAQEVGAERDTLKGREPKVTLQSSTDVQSSYLPHALHMAC